LIVDSLRVVDAVLKVETPFGPCWRRYNNDGYGQKEDGGPFAGWGKGRGWPLLAGERGHFELAAGRDAKPFIRAMEGFSSATGLLPEQVWDEPDRADVYMYLGRPTGSAMPLMWAHAEYIKLLRSVADGRVFDLIPEVAERYLSGQNPRHRIEVWKHNWQVSSLRRNSTLRVQAASPFRLHWTTDEWHTVNDTPSAGTALGIDFVDVPIPVEQRAPVRFTFFWTNNSSWEDHDYLVKVES
jgi:glucoamylase